MSVRDLLNKAAPPPEEPTEAPDPTGLRERIARAKARPKETMTVEVSFGDAVAEVVLTEISGGEWNEIACMSLPRPGNATDAFVGSNTDRLLELFPVDRITIDGDHPTEDEWLEVLQLLEAPFREDIATALSWIHVGRPRQELAEAIKRADALKAVETAGQEKNDG